MHPAFSVVLLTTLIGAAQGLMLGLVGIESLARLRADVLPHAFLIGGSGLALVLAGLGLLASFFHLGHPERAWRAIAGWRTSWLSREVIVLPAFMGMTALYGFAHHVGLGPTLGLGAVVALLALLLFVCTGMIYAAVKVIREWASVWTVINYTVLGMTSGLSLAAALAAFTAPVLVPGLSAAALASLLLGACTRAASLWRNAHLKPKSTLQSAIGVRHPRIVQKSQGSMGGSFNTREFFHGRPRAFVQGVFWSAVLAAFVLPALLLGSGITSAAGLVMIFGVQYVGLLAERWFFFAQANHPQNLYYQSVA
ncbi:MAG: dimethyl sulfoxide reductase anchor subunit family protein [Leptothrix ochracea]|uniref:dimethyl sulfoxide reductase anchor subunit family protein n=1 Tax=Leptothrix ochracea TaxID=735331 RepID=UPI0034E2BE93